ncbi:ComEC/Rec2 family competence protein [Acetobacter sp.]|uniref:ComEC/Rec2 family competence protein n=1 Tax=Acetobacter sp. TaxID=440 RepID=UPI0025BBFDE0|nr:ComEC/Rec2 family competence protein [Acetobacter sp.]MCH4091803.1 ComEC family competence protein [Acetobacter sp.]MCI1300341.1 ComEC family competence protein [Acetobacter sp.]MCI1316841.1 ComEC family competence protein [Acetobacter sp.]
MKGVLTRLQTLLLSERHRLPLWLPVFIALGVLAYFQPLAEPVFWWAPAGLVLSAPFLIVGWHRLGGRMAGCALLCLSLGFLAAWSENHRVPPMPELPRRAVILTGHVQAVDVLPARTEGAPGGRRVTLSHVRFETWLDEGMAPLKRTLRIRLRDDDSLIFGPGNDLRVRALLEAPPFPVMPGARDLQREAWFGKEAGTGRALGAAVLADDAEQGTAATAFERLREAIAARIAAVLPGSDGAIASTLLVGLSGGIAAKDREAFSVSGLSHLLAVAGLHLGIVMGLVVTGVRYGLASIEWTALRWPCKEIAVICGLLGGVVYVTMTGMHLPALRSLIMACLVVLALVTGRNAASMRGLAVAATVLLLTGPAVILGVPFQMSFAAVMALIAGYEVLRVPLRRLHGEGTVSRRFLVHVTTLALTSLLAGTATLPVSMAHFGEIQPFFVVANLLAVPMTALWVMPAGLLAVLLMPLHLERWALDVMGWGVDGIIWLAESVAHWPAARIAVPMTPGWGLTLFLFGLCWLCLWSRKWRLFGVVPMLVGFLSPFFQSLPDAVITPDGGLVAVREGGQLLMNGQSRDAWFERRALEQAFARPVVSLPVRGETASGDLACGEDGAAGVCVLTRGKRSILLRVEDATDGEAILPAEMCQGMDLFVAVSPARSSCRGVPVIDRFTVWREGAVAVWITDSGLRMLSDRRESGDRLWVMRPGRHGVPNLPLAKEDER